MAGPSFQRLFMPLYRLAHWPEPALYSARGDDWEVYALLDKHGLGPGQTVLEVGCGDGSTALALAERFDRVIGLDMNPTRMTARNRARVSLLVGDAERLPLAERSVDVIISVALFEHLTDPDATMRHMASLLRPGGVMLHYMPRWPWKLLQFALFYPERVRKELRALTRSLAGQRKRREKPEKYHAGKETNNPKRESRRKWHRHLVPRVHGEHDSHWAETRAWTDQTWIDLYRRAGLEVVDVRAGPFHSPYQFGFKPLAKLGGRAGLSSAKVWMIRRADDATTSPGS
jgi:ubiquinone/menaquinone biosynthesis C-methylase UbiE